MRLLAPVLALWSLAACTAGQPDATPNGTPARTAGGPAQGQRYGLGRPLADSAVASWNTDIGPGGADLPPGHGSVAEGEVLYRAQCASCHGAHGEGIKPAYPALIGRDPKAEGFHFASDLALTKTIGNYWPHAITVFDYVRRSMPYAAPGSLTNDQVYALTAYLLAANEVIPDTTTLDAESLRRVKMPYADKFVPDRRRGGPEVR